LSFKLIQNPDFLEFHAINTISSYRNAEDNINHGGLGLENIKKRLDLLYGEKHQLIIEKTDLEFKVKLVIPI
jgi:two-component system LytT family sensor kinase